MIRRSARDPVSLDQTQVAPDPANPTDDRKRDGAHDGAGDGLVQLDREAQQERLNHELRIAYAELEAQYQELQEAQARGADVEHRYRMLFDTAPCGYVVLEPTGRIKEVNERLLQLLGLHRHYTVNQPFQSLIDKEHRARFERCLHRLREGSPAQELDIDCLAPSADRIPVTLRIARIARSRHSAPEMLCSVSDERRHRAIEQRKIHSQKLEALGVLAGGVAHDVNNVLQAIQGHAEILIADETHAERLEMLSTILMATRRGGRMTQQLQAFCRDQPNSPRIIEVSNSVREALNLLRPLLGRDVKLRSVLPEEPLRVCLDPAEFSQVLVNLATNSRDALPSGGQIRVSARPVRIEERDWVEVRFADNGIGMSNDALNRIFDPFYTTKLEDGGTGLGLSTSYGLIRKAGGTLTALSRPRRGAMFTIRLPLSHEPVDADPHRHATNAPEFTRSTGNACVIDDSPEVLEAMRRMLRAIGYGVMASTDPARILRACAVNGETPIDVLVTDIDMAEMSGIQLARSVRRFHPDVRVIYVSGKPQPAARQPSPTTESEIPQGEWLVKPFTIRDLAAALARDANGDVGSAPSP